jgi:alkylation response protein AidB-like acyl-CoA dehydrogenase
MIDAARRFAAEVIAPQAAAWEAAGAMPRDVFRQAGALGLIGMEVPIAHGGAGLGFAAKAEICEILAGADFGVAMAVVNSHNVAKKLAETAAPEIVRAFLPDLLSGERIGCTALTEPTAGSDFSAIRMRAEACDGGWRLTGEKAWITNATQADTIIVYAQTKAAGDVSGVAAFLVDARREGFMRGESAAAFGLHACGSGAFRLDRYLVRENAVIGAPGLAFKSILNEINGARIYVAAMCCGMLDSALRVVGDYGGRRKAFGKPLSQHQGWRWIQAEAAVELAGARALTKAAAQALEAGEDVQLAAAQAKILASRVAVRRLPELLHAMGAEGLRRSHPLGRHLIGAQFAGLVDGSTEMLLERVAKLITPS